MILCACSAYFKNLLDPIIILKDVPFGHLTAILKFMYAGEVNVPQVPLTATSQLRGDDGGHRDPRRAGAAGRALRPVPGVRRGQGGPHPLGPARPGQPRPGLPPRLPARPRLDRWHPAPLPARSAQVAAGLDVG